MTFGVSEPSKPCPYCGCPVGLHEEGANFDAVTIGGKKFRGDFKGFVWKCNACPGIRSGGKYYRTTCLSIKYEKRHA